MQPSEIAPRDRLIVALDLPGTAVAEAMIARLGDTDRFYDIACHLYNSPCHPDSLQLAVSGK
jgi:orotidine-5'-phosphate decarboxylase